MKNMASPPETFFQGPGKCVKAFLLDIFGVLLEGSGLPGVPGCIEAYNRLKANNVPVRLCSNNSSKTVSVLCQELQSHGCHVTQDEIFTPLTACREYLKKHQLRPMLLVKDEVRGEFRDIDQTDPNCVVVGYAHLGFSYENLNKAFQLLMQLEKPRLICVSRAKYYKKGAGLQLDVGAFITALEFASDIKAEVIGKPNPAYFMTPLDQMGVKPHETVMVGDDILSDVAGAQAVGMKGIQVRTGKFRPQDEPHATVTPDLYVDSLAEAVDCYLAGLT